MKKVGNHNSFSKILFFCLALMLSFTTVSFAQDVAKGKELFNSNCAACHKLDGNATGPALRGIVDQHDGDVAWLHKWIKSSSSLIKSGDAKAVKVFEEWNKVVMNDFPGLSDEDIDNILAYTSEPKAEPKAVAGVAAGGQQGGNDGVSNMIVLGALVIVLLLLVTMLYFVKRVLNKVVEANGLTEEVQQTMPLWKAFVKNQFLVIVSVVVMVLFGSYFLYGYLMQIGVDQGYEPVQPIHFSHKIHAGDNGIDCKYCHSAARTSKTSGIPSLNVCMNCHENISEFTGEEGKEYDYTPEFYTGEIQKLYDAVGWDVSTQKYTGKEKPVKWVRIHNLPDFAYYNHSQHVNVAGLECQTCHGPVEEMEIMRQFAPLTMGWCIECHRTTDVKMEGNEYYAKIHEELSEKYGVEKLTVAQMGGLECAKCHY